MGFPSHPGGGFIVVETIMPWTDGTAGGTQIAHGINASFIRPLLYETTAGGGRRYLWGNWRILHSADQPWSPLSVQGGLEKDFDRSAVFAVKNGVGYVKFHNVFFNRVHTGAPFLVSRVPSEYAPSWAMHIALAPAYWETNVNKRMILEVRANGEIWCISNTHAGTMMTSEPIALV